MDVAFCWELWTSVDAMNPAPPVIGRFESFQRAANKSSCCCYLERGFFLHQCKRITQCMGISALPSRRQLPGVRERDWGLGLCGRCIFFISPSAKDTMRVECLGVCEGRVWGLPSCVSRGEEAKDCLLILRSCDMMEKKKVWACPLSPPSLHQTSVVVISVVRAAGQSSFFFAHRCVPFPKQRSCHFLRPCISHRASAASPACIYFECT